MMISGATSPAGAALMNNRQRGSVLVITIIVLVLVSGMIIVGSDMHLRFAREARATEDHLRARHIAYSGIACIETGMELSTAPHPFDSGTFAFSSIDIMNNTLKLTIRGEVSGLAGIKSVYETDAVFQKSGNVWKYAGKRSSSQGKNHE
jgi:Tfp pilus assembly protein PilX